MKKIKFIFAITTCLLAVTSCGSLKNVNKNNKGNINQPIDEDKVTVTFDANDGVMTGKSVVSVDSGTKFGNVTKPTVTKQGVDLSGWYITTPGSYVESTYEITSALTVHADWKTYNVTFNSGEGKFLDGTTTKTLSNVLIVHGEDVDVPMAPVDKVFDGWELNSTKISFPYKPTDNVTITAKYKAVETVNVVLMAKEGTFSDGKKSISAKVAKGTTLADAITENKLQYPTRDGDYLFANYQLNGTDIDGTHKFDKSELLVAKYDDALEITFNANGGKYSDSETSKSSGKIKYDKTLKVSEFISKITVGNPTITVGSSTTYNLSGWALDINSNTPVSLDATLESLDKKNSFILYAYYETPHETKYSGSSGVNFPTDITFKRNETKEFVITPQAGYSLSTDKVDITYDSTTYKNTIITKSLDESTGNITVKVENAPGGDVNIKVTSTANTYNVTNSTSTVERAKFIDGDTGLVVPSTATYNSDVEITSIPKDGYTPSKITITYDGGSKDVSFVKGDSVYKATFKMEYAKDISIAAYATAIDYKVTSGTHDTGVGTVKFNDSTSLTNAHVGDTITVTASNNTGYTLNEIEVSGTGFETIKASITTGTATFTMPAADVTVKVTANINKYTLTLNGNGGTPSVSSIADVAYGSNLKTTIGSTTATLTDAQFKGWGLDSSKQDILSGTETMPDATKTVYAIWNKYKFIFQVPTTDPHGSVSGTTEYGPQITLSSSEITGLTVTPNTGYSFTGTYKVTGEGVAAGITTDFSNPLKPGAFDTPIKTDATIYLEPVFEAIKYDVSFTYGPNEHLSSDTPIEVPYGTKLLDTSKVTLPTATHDFAKFNSWYDDSGNKITDTTTMPANAITLHPTWDTYTIDIVVENGSSSKTQFKDVLEVHSDEFTITPSEGYEFNNKYQYSTDGGSTYKDLASMPFRPYALDTTITSSSSIKLKAICEETPKETVDVVLYAPNGTFTSTGSDQKTVTVIKNKTWVDIKDNISSWSSDLTPPSSKKFDHWSLSNGGAEVPDATIFNDDMLIFAVFVDA